MKHCAYYQAKVDKSLTWFFVATFRSFENIAFDRTFDVQNGIFEFFVPECLEDFFVTLLHHYQENKIVSEIKKLPNRFV